MQYVICMSVCMLCVLKYCIFFMSSQYFVRNIEFLSHIQSCPKLQIKKNYVVCLQCIRFIRIHTMIQAGNQEFFRAGEFSWNQGTLVNIHPQHEKERPRKEKICGFSPGNSNFILKEKFYPQMLTIRGLFFHLGQFSNF